MSTPADTDNAAAAAATNRHYDLPAEIFACFLGTRMKYTCGLYATAETTLDQAQEAKLGFIAECLGITGGEHVLDIGVGWGSLAFYLAERFDCQVLGITPSSQQAAYVRDRATASGLDRRVHVRERSVYDLDPAEAAFDAVALVGVIEHMPDQDRALALAAGSLRRDGRLYLSASCYRSQEVEAGFADRAASRQVTESVFGYANLHPLSALIAAAESARLSVSGVTDLTSHYHRTVADWLAGVRASAERIDAIRPGLANELATYLETTNTGWGYTTKQYAFTAVRSRWGLTQWAP